MQLTCILFFQILFVNNWCYFEYCFQDLATHTRVSPAQRKITMGKFVDSVNRNPEARQELLNWGLSFDTDTIHVSLQIKKFSDYYIVHLHFSVCGPGWPSGLGS